VKLDHIRNFCIVAHIDHGKSTLADRLIESTGTLQKREMKAQVLDTLDLERERGITIKLNAVRMTYRADSGDDYEFNLIDTPGHVDFTYEVSRSLAACEGAILVVDASQGIQAQTLSNLFLALDAGLEIVPVLNKIDLPGAEPERRKKELHDLIGADEDEILLVSAKEGVGIHELLEAVVRKVPAPEGDPDAPLRALIFDSYYDRYRGAIPSIRVVDGTITRGMKLRFAAGSGSAYEVAEVGYNQLRQVETESLGPGEVGYVVANVRSVKETRAGDTVLDVTRADVVPLPGYKEIHSMVFAGLYPTDTQQYEGLRDALEKLQLNDASLRYEPETSTALGFGFRAGFLGLLHMEIVQERLEREFDLSLVTTVPTVEYHLHHTDGTLGLLESPAKMPPPDSIDRIEEPYVKARIMAPAEYIGGIMTLIESGTDFRGNITFAAVADHMGQQTGSIDLFRRHQFDHCVLAELTDMQIYIAHRGRYYFDISTIGRSAHTCHKYLAINAIEKMLPVIEEISKLTYFPDISQDMKELVGPELFTAVGRIYGGLFPGGPSMIPDRCTIRVDTRPQPGVSIEEARAIIQAAIDRARAREPELVVEMVDADIKDSFMVDPAAPIVVALKAAWEAAMGKPARFHGGSWLGDTASFGRLCETVIFGPGGAPVYQPNESLALADIEAATRIYAMTAATILRAA